MTIRKSSVVAYLRRDFDSFTWMKELLREDIMQELRGMRVRPYFKTTPWLHQLVCFYIALCSPRFLFLLNCGLGKSKIIMDIMTQLQREQRLTRALVTVPSVITMDSWQEDILRHSDLQPWHCDVEESEEKWERLINPQGDVTLIDYQGLHWALCRKKKSKKKGGKGVLVIDDKRVEQVKKLYNFIGADESHKLGNHQSLWFGLMRQLTQETEFVYATTGTLFGRNIEAAWAQFFLVDGGATFGENLGLFREAFFLKRTTPWKVEYSFNRKMDRKFHQMLQHRSIRYGLEEVPELDLPSCVKRKTFVNLGEEQKEHYLRATEGLINAAGDLHKLEGAWVRMRQIVSGYLQWADGTGEHVVRFKHNPKLDELERRLDELGDNKVVIAYDYTETGKMIVELLTKLGIKHEWFYGGTRDKSGSRRRFMTDPDCQAFVMNSAAGGTGTDGLQKVAHYLFFYESPVSPGTREQTESRIHRPGQQERSFVFDIVAKRTVDQGILDSLESGIDLFAALVNGKSVSKNMLFC